MATLKVAPLMRAMFLANVLLLFYATCVSAEVSQHLVVEEASSRSLVDRGGPKCEAGTFDWTQCKSEGGPKNCAKCKGGDLGDNGALPCGSASVDCPDNKLWKGQFFIVNGMGEGECKGSTTDAGLKGIAMTTYAFPGGICNSSAPELLRNLVATKAYVTHPHKASRNVGVVIFKRLVMHRCTGTNPAFCKKGTEVADVFKV